jgi:NitT/TauT family transport system permease protein
MTTVLTPVVEVPVATHPGTRGPGRLWAWAWPKLLAVGLVLAVWQVVVWAGWRPEYVLPGPAAVLATLSEMIGTPKFWQAVATTLTRAVVGFTVALVIGSVIGILVARIRPLRLAVGALITGLQTMPSISWFPLAILLFGLNERAILFVVVLGAAPSIANGVISGIDHVPPAYTRLGRVLGAGPVEQYRFITLPAALPAYVSGLTQGWAFAWRSLMAGELLVIIAGRPSLGANLEFARQFSQADRLLATMLVVLVIGMLVDGVFSSASRRLRRRWGLTGA